LIATKPSRQQHPGNLVDRDAAAALRNSSSSRQAAAAAAGVPPCCLWNRSKCVKIKQKNSKENSALCRPVTAPLQRNAKLQQKGIGQSSAQTTATHNRMLLPQRQKSSLPGCLVDI